MKILVLKRPTTQRPVLNPRAEAPAQAESRYEFRALADGSQVELIIYGRIWGTSYDDTMVGADRIARDLATVPNASKITVKINSQGGDVFAGNAIYNTLKNHPALVTAYIDGVAASAASIIAMAGDTVVMPRNGLMMIHKPWVCAEGDDEELAKASEALKKITAAFSTAYQAKTGLDDAAVMALMKAETWLTADEAVEQGFADEVDLQNAVQTTAQGSTITVNGLALDTKAFKNAPQALLASATHKEPTPREPGQSTEVTMKIKALFAALRRNFGAALHPRLNQDLDAAEAQMADDASAEDVASRITAIFQGALNAAQALVAPLTEAGITTAEEVTALLANAQAGEAYRKDMVTAMLAAGVKAKGDEFDKPRYERMAAAMTLEDIKAQTAEFEAEARARLGEPGRQTNAQDPNKGPEGAAKGDAEAEGKPEAIEAFLKRTARA